MTNYPQEEIQKFVGEPKSHWIGDQWIPAEGSHLYTTDEIRKIFLKECTLFVGDSLQRRAADTLHLMLSTSDKDHVSDVRDEVFADEFFKQKKHDRGFQRRTILQINNNISNNNNSNGTRSQQLQSNIAEIEFSSNSQQRNGCVDTDWRPLLHDVNEFVNDFKNQTDIYKHYSVVVVGSSIWDVVGSSRRVTSANELRSLVNHTIFKLGTELPSSLLIVWKSSGWCDNCGWTPVDTKRNNGDNYKVFAINDQAEKSVQSLNLTNFIYLDWSREILPRSFGNERLRSNDRNPYHYGLQPRLQFLQMLSEVYDHRQTTKAVLPSPLQKIPRNNSPNGVAVHSSTSVAASDFTTYVGPHKVHESVFIAMMGLLILLQLFTGRRTRTKRSTGSLKH